MRTSKPIWKSKTVWFNVLSVLAALTAAPEVLRLAEGNPDWIRAMAAFSAAGNILLRIFTSQTITK